MNTKLPGQGHAYEEMKRVARILEIVQMIALNPRRYLRRDLADHFELTTRMIQKDLDVIRNGLKLSLLHSSQGYYFEEMPRLPVLQYTLTEALILFLAVQAAQQISGIGSPDLAAAVARLKALFPPEFENLLNRLMRQPVETVQREHRCQMLMLFNKAWIEERKVRIIYKTRSRGGAVSERVIWPYHIVPYVRSWHLIAYCEWRKKVIMFKVDRVQQATLLDEHYSIPKDFNPEEYIGRTWGMMRGDNDAKPVDVVLHFEQEAGHWVAEEYWHSSQTVEELPDGSILFRLNLIITSEFVNWLLYYGSRVKVLEPESLRAQVMEEHRKAAKIQESLGDQLSKNQ
jgi:predicted DNA-binding transcriptional regulator YafY